MHQNEKLQTLKRRVEDRLARRAGETVVGLRHLVRILEAVRDGLVADERGESALPALEAIVEQAEEALDQMDVLSGDFCLDGDPEYDEACSLS